MLTARRQILQAYAEWTVLSALRSGSPLRSRVDVYRAIRLIDFESVLKSELGPIEEHEFEGWHSTTLVNLVKNEARLRNEYGWAAKIVNIYLKTISYVGTEGRSGLRSCLHPPIDKGLWKGISTRFKDRKDILHLTHCVTKIKSIRSHSTYLDLMGLRGNVWVNPESDQV